MEEREIPHKLTNRDLYEKQMKMLKGFLDRGAISKLQYDTSVQGLKEKMKC